MDQKVSEPSPLARLVPCLRSFEEQVAVAHQGVFVHGPVLLGAAVFDQGVGVGPHLDERLHHLKRREGMGDLVV